METRLVEDRHKVIQEVFSGFYRVNRKAKMVLELLGFRSAAALPDHLHAAVLQVLLMGPVIRPPCKRSLSPFAVSLAQPLPLRSEGCVIQCLFADWLTKTSKWLKVPRYRYVVLLSVLPKPEPEEGRPRVDRNNSTIHPVVSAAEEASQSIGGQSEFAGLNQKCVQKPFPQLLLVTFKAPQMPPSRGGLDPVDSYGLQRAEPSEVFSIDSTHRAVCQRIPSGKDSQLVLIVEGLGGRLLVLGELYPSAASPSGITGIQLPGTSPLERLAHLINQAAPFCAAPRPSRWRRLLQLFAATATAVDLGESVAILPFGGNRVKQHGKADKGLMSESQSATECSQVNGTTSKEAYTPRCARTSSVHSAAKTCAARSECTLRQLIDDQQRSLAACAVREYRKKVALVQREYQMSRQHASRALMDEHGQLFPQVRLQYQQASFLVFE
ncbi:hypothetical protein, conserved [Eimeria brunetti]|uniref:Uncharacterized protein n=1 Tax=Eimeria brunetti TaxID=51314 RepID=U6LA21_9EIME|nr:hypothetical protein, conserved [Eimeria brunetti]